MTTAEVVATLAPLKGLNVEDCNGHFQDLLAERIRQTGKPAEQFTVGEMGGLIRLVTKEFNEVNR